jgi:hypothetical protein
MRGDRVAPFVRTSRRFCDPRLRIGKKQDSHPRFWRPVLYQLSYTPISISQRRSRSRRYRVFCRKDFELGQPALAGRVLIADRKALSSLAAAPGSPQRAEIGSDRPGIDSCSAPYRASHRAVQTSVADVSVASRGVSLREVASAAIAKFR